MVRAQRNLARHARDHIPETVFSFFDPFEWCFREVRPEWIDPILNGQIAVDSSLIADPGKSRRRFYVGRGRRLAKVYHLVTKTRRTMIAALEPWRTKTAGSRIGSTIGWLQKRLMKDRERRIYFDEAGNRRLCPPLEAVLGPSVAFKPDDRLISAQSDWVHTNVEETLTAKRQWQFYYVILCYDVIPIVHPEWYHPHDVTHFRDHYIKAFAGADRVIFNSERTRQDARDFCSRQGLTLADTTISPLGSNLPKPVDYLRPLPNGLEPGHYALYVATIEPRKNHRVLLEAWKLLIAEGIVAAASFKLVFVGRPGWMMDAFFAELAEEPEFGKTILHLSNIQDDVLAALYRKAAFCLYPSLYEGYGLPFAEAMAYGKPVVASTAGAVQELAADRCVCLDPHDPLPWRDEMRRLIMDGDYLERQTNRVQSYRPITWEDAATAFFAAVARPFTK